MNLKLHPKLIDSLQQARHVVVFTGAGASKDSGIPTFREKTEGLWSKFDAKRFSTPEGFQREPAVVWSWYEQLRHTVQVAQPNAGHMAIARLAKHVPKVSVITQNVDDLHERAVSEGVLHLHGSLFAPRCSVCSLPHDLSPPAALAGKSTALEPPLCRQCGEKVRPGVVWFGEGLTEGVFAKATAVVDDCDMFFSVGTSVDVYPAASLAFRAAKKKVCVVQINPARTDLNHRATFNLKEKAAIALPSLLRTIWGEEISHA